MKVVTNVLILWQVAAVIVTQDESTDTLKKALYKIKGKKQMYIQHYSIQIDASLLDHLLHEAAALAKSMTYEYKIDVLFKAGSQLIKILASAALCIDWFHLKRFP